MNIKVAILAHPDIALFELGCATELFGLHRPEFSDGYSAEVVCFESGPFKTIAGVQITARQITTLEEFDMLVIPSWPVQKSQIPATLAKAIKESEQMKKRILSFCSGSFLLGYLGLLNNRMATTHWRYESVFRSIFPSTHYAPNVLYTLDQHLGCSAGSSAAIDLGLAVIREDYGSARANSIARRLVLSGHRKGGQSQFVETPVEVRPNRVSDAIEWALAKLDGEISIDSMADQATMSRRNFDRTFRKQLGVSPQEWLISQRIVLARRLIEESGANIEEVASRTGFSSAGNLRHHFRKHLGVSPRQYRDNFCH